MMPSSALPSNNRRSGMVRFLPHWVPMLFIAAFVVVIGVNAALIFFAEETFSGLETASPYERGLDYNKTLAAEAVQERLGWRLETVISGDGADRTLRVRMTGGDGRPLDGLELQAYLVRPSNEGLDVTIAPRPAGDGAYVARFILPTAGQWDLRLVARQDGTVWQHSERLFLK
jgi:nitrogen fixation protein FixH